MKSTVRQSKGRHGAYLIIIELYQGRMEMIRPWLSANSLGSKSRVRVNPESLVRYRYFEPEPEKPARRPSDMNKQNPLLNLLRSEVE